MSEKLVNVYWTVEFFNKQDNLNLQLVDKETWKVYSNTEFSLKEWDEEYLLQFKPDWNFEWKSLSIKFWESEIFIKLQDWVYSYRQDLKVFDNVESTTLSKELQNNPEVSKLLEDDFSSIEYKENFTKVKDMIDKWASNNEIIDYATKENLKWHNTEILVPKEEILNTIKTDDKEISIWLVFVILLAIAISAFVFRKRIFNYLRKIDNEKDAR